MRELADDARVGELIQHLASSIEKTLHDEAWALVGIRSRGDVLAERLAKCLGRKRFVGVGTLDITLYRDDLSEIGPQPVVRTTEIPFNLDGSHIILVDDVLMTGRSIRAALQSLMDFGRPARVWLAVLVDRGGRELPICPDHVGLAVGEELEPGEHVQVLLEPVDPHDAVLAGRPT
jgi:pyrimidine operon attenuation protein/uracil phosphoribosyltransferase